ncbi:MAG: hypothetical protein EAZ98_21985 [Oscillatoriales cyanobacterium]|nr:MAG: hypothetical protein EAZ98_21985 [Oscillatoriales cyanobacterium]
MASSQPLKGIELIDCAKVNKFDRELKLACQNIGVQFQELSDLITDQQMVQSGMGIEVAPDTPSEL